MTTARGSKFDSGEAPAGASGAGKVPRGGIDTPSESRTPNPGISHYRLVDRIAQGGFGDVWLGEDTQLPRRVAVKLLPADRSRDPEAVQQLLREARAAASVSHPAVVTVYEAGVAGGCPFLIMELLEGETLEERLKQGALTIAEAIDVARHVADALAEVHALGIVHRDLKGANVMLTRHGPKVLDFGIARLRETSSPTPNDLQAGTPAVMSPEQVMERPLDNRTDLWALGVILYQCLTGSLPFHGPIDSVVYQICSVDPPLPSALRAEVGADLDHIVMKLLRKNPRHRYASAEDLLADLANSENLRLPRRGAGDASATRAVPRIAVLYFEVLSHEPRDSLIAVGITEDLIVDLSRVRGVRVASREEVREQRERTVPHRTLGRALGVDYLLHGSVQSLGHRTRITVQLVRALDRQVIWAERFERELDDLFDVQAEVSHRIVRALELALRPEEDAMLDRPPTRDARTYALYLEALDGIDRIDEAANRDAESRLRRALDMDPDFAQAHAALANVLAQRVTFSWGAPESGELALQSAARALELEPDLIDALMAKATVHRQRGEPREVLRVLERVMVMDPDHPKALEWVASCYMVLGQPADAVPILEGMTARYRDRYFPPYYLSLCYDTLGRKQEAERAFRLAIEREIEFVQRHPENAHARSILAISLARAGQANAARVQVERALALAPGNPRVRYNAACALARAGFAEDALAELRQAMEHLPLYHVRWARVDPDLQSLREHRAFEELLGHSSGSVAS